MSNKLRKLEKELRSYAKRVKGVSYTSGLLIAFLLMGILSLANATLDKEILKSKVDIKDMTTEIKELFTKAKKENTKLLKDKSLELIQLMEQGDQVVKSPWSSWQFGVNTFIGSNKGRYSGKGDKFERYLYEGVYNRSNDIFHKTVSPISKKYSKVFEVMNKSIDSSNTQSGLDYGITQLKRVDEPIVEVGFMIGVRPKEVEKPVNIKVDGDKEITFREIVLPKFQIPEDEVVLAPATGGQTTNNTSQSLKKIVSQADYANIKKGNGESGTLVGQMESDVAGPISQTNINGKNGKGTIEIIHNNTDEFTIKSENTIFTGIEGTDHHQVFTYDTNLNNKYRYEAETGPMVIRAGGGHNFEISNMNITSKGEIEEVITNIFELNTGNNQKTKLTLKENTDVVVDSNLTTVSKLTNHTSNSSLDFINEGKITLNNKHNTVSMFVNMNNNNISYFENKGDIIINGESNRGIREVRVSGINPIYFFKNEGNLILNGEKNFFLPATTEAEAIIQFNKPLQIRGKLNRGAILVPSNRKFDVMYNGKLEKSYFNMELSGERNTGIYIFDTSSSIGNTVNIENFNLKSINGKQNNLVAVVNELKNKTTTLSKNGEHSNFEIIGGEGNTAIQVAASQNVKNEGSIKLTDATSSTAIASRGVVNKAGVVIPAAIKNEGNITVEGKSTKALHAYADGEIVNVGEIKFFGDTSSTNIGASAIYSNAGGKIESTGKSDITVSGTKSVGLFAQNTGTNSKFLNTSTIKMSNANITAKNGAFNVFANKGGEITLNENNVLNTENQSLTFYTNYSQAAPGGKIIVNNDITVNVKNGGTVFYYDLTNITSGNYNFMNWYNDNFQHNNGSKLKLNMSEKSRMMLLGKASVKLNEIPDRFPDNPHIEVVSNNNWIPFSIIEGKVFLDSDINLDNASEKYNRIELIRNSIKNEKMISGTLKNQLAIGQENNNTNSSADITLENEGTINLTGNNSVAMYTKRGKILNKNEISVNKDSVGLYLIENNGTTQADGEIRNSGNIKIGENSSGIFYKGIKTGTNNAINGIYNSGSIKSEAKKAKGIYFNSQFSTKEVKNEATGKIELNGANSLGMSGLGNGNYTMKNLGEIKIGSSDNLLLEAGLGMYTEKANITLKNSGKISVGENDIAMYGHKILTDTSSNIKVGNKSIGVYSASGDSTLQGEINLSSNSTGVMLVGNNQNLISNFSNMNLSDGTFGIVNNGDTNTITSNTNTVNLNNDTIFLYSNDINSKIYNNTKINTIGNSNYLIYSKGEVENRADIDMRNGIGNIGIYSTGLRDAKNYNTIKVGNSSKKDGLYSIGMVTGYYNTENGTIQNVGKIINENTGKIEVEGEFGVGMYAVGTGATAINNGEILLKGKNSIGMFLDRNAIGINNGTILGTPDAVKAVGAIVSNGAVLKNYGTIRILANNGTGVWLSKKGEIEEYASSTAPKVPNSSTIIANTRIKKSNIIEGEKGLADDSVKIKVFKDRGIGEVIINSKNIEIEGIEKNINNSNSLFIEKYKDNKIIEKFEIDESKAENTKSKVSKIGMYVDTSGIRQTNPVEGLENLEDEIEADLILGTEATKYTNSKAIEIKENILKPFADAIATNPNIEKWNIYSGSLTWIGTILVTPEEDNIRKVYLAKIPYTKFAGDGKTEDEKWANYNFLDGLEQRYGVEAINSRERELYNKLNGIGKNERILLTQAVDEMKGHQYANTQMRIKNTGDQLNKEFEHLMKDWYNPSKQNNKIKVFGMKEDYSTDTAGIKDFESNSYGVAYVHEDETIKLGQETGWYAGAIYNRFRFKDIGKSVEDQNMIKLGVFKSTAFDNNGSLKWKVSLDGFVGMNDMERQYLVVDEIFGAKSRYYTYGIGLKNEVSKDYRLSEHVSLVPYGSLNVEYGRFTTIKEKKGEVRLEIKGNHYISVKPEVGAELKFNKKINSEFKLTLSAGIAYELELGKVYEANNKARVNYTNADWYNLANEKENRTGNLKGDFKFGLEKNRFGLTLNVGYDTRGNNLRGGIGLRAVF